MSNLYSLVHQGRERLNQAYETGKAHSLLTVEQLKSFDENITQHTKGFLEQSCIALKHSYPFLITGLSAAVIFYPSLKVWGARTAFRNSFVFGSITAVSLYPDFKQVVQGLDNVSQDTSQ
ncbi:hypothetical protein Gasu2_54160 [Galdieria sulphuraria]|uniref:Uncharacterized protein n=1 Tax=Galdieria sulphuraria TaxID=130081 RepID=M2XT08_GALSU|nr:uncharacterized protein Gasu_55850 [Galdieria sulphuraria]EME26793.1 hypothetical protein Gasu_55850 [Galdieria sulphuraria]GJD11276.1 hypothetical protein Gasu2_54160 [Galdieria sulphuraria]|eukprot:XP_005703313.1 hypothetical protein Gasu_55850 [Galdieria sulphuraria]